MIEFEGISLNRYLQYAGKEDWTDLPFLSHTVLKLEELFGNSVNFQKKDSILENIIYFLNCEPKGEFLEYFTKTLLLANDGNADNIRKIGLLYIGKTDPSTINTKIRQLTTPQNLAEKYDAFINLPNRFILQTTKRLEEEMHPQQAIDYNAEAKEIPEPAPISNYEFNGKDVKTNEPV